MKKTILILLLVFSVLFIGACSSGQSYNPPSAPSGGGCGVIASSIATICSDSSINELKTG